MTTKIIAAPVPQAGKSWPRIYSTGGINGADFQSVFLAGKPDATGESRYVCLSGGQQDVGMIFDSKFNFVKSSYVHVEIPVQVTFNP